jgi:flagellar assembly protein FliH
MSSSPSRAPITPDPLPAKVEPPVAVPFAYTAVERKPGANNFLPGGFGVAGGTQDPSAVAATAAREAQIREAGRQEGQSELRARFEEQIVRERSAVAGAVADFARDRAQYYQRIEEEAVRLALSIARKILHREAQVDPLLLMGVVKVAIERMEGATEVTLVVHPQKAADWRRQLAVMTMGKPPEIVEDAAMEPDQCKLRTSMGTADLSLDGQLKEIEAGLTDLLAARPKG